MSVTSNVLAFSRYGRESPCGLTRMPATRPDSLSTSVVTYAACGSTHGPIITGQKKNTRVPCGCPSSSTTSPIMYSSLLIAVNWLCTPHCHGTSCIRKPCGCQNAARRLPSGICAQPTIPPVSLMSIAQLSGPPKVSSGAMPASSL